MELKSGIRKLFAGSVAETPVEIETPPPVVQEQVSEVRPVAKAVAALAIYKEGSKFDAEGNLIPRMQILGLIDWR